MGIIRTYILRQSKKNTATDLAINIKLLLEGKSRHDYIELPPPAIGILISDFFLDF